MPQIDDDIQVCWWLQQFGVYVHTHCVQRGCTKQQKYKKQQKTAKTRLAIALGVSDLMLSPVDKYLHHPVQLRQYCILLHLKHRC